MTERRRRAPRLRGHRLLQNLRSLVVPVDAMASRAYPCHHRRRRRPQRAGMEKLCRRKNGLRSSKYRSRGRDGRLPATEISGARRQRERRAPGARGLAGGGVDRLFITPRWTSWAVASHERVVMAMSVFLIRMCPGRCENCTAPRSRVICYGNAPASRTPVVCVRLCKRDALDVSAIVGIGDVTL